MRNKRNLPALESGSKLNNPDLNDIGSKNYTDIILRYGNLTTKFPQLHTYDKTVVGAINEIFEGGNTGHVTLTQEQYDVLPESEKMNGTIYFISDA